MTPAEDARVLREALAAGVTRGERTASQYLDDGRWGVLLADNRILVSTRSTGLTDADARLLAVCDPDRIQRLLNEREELIAALADVVNCDWAYLGPDADTSDPNSLYCRVKRGRAVLSKSTGAEA